MSCAITWLTVQSFSSILKSKGKTKDEEKATQKGKMLYYFGLYYSMKGNTNLAAKYFAEVTNMQSPLFFEYRLAEWGLQK